jgi:tetratricopeptide (TPR) repeat protein
MKKTNLLNSPIQPLKPNSNDKAFYNTEGVKKADEFKFKEAFEYFTKAIELDPKYYLSYFNRATIEMEMGNILGAMSDFKLSERFRLLDLSQII